MSLEKVLSTVKEYYSMGASHKQLLYFPDFTESTTEQEETAMIDKAISAIEMNSQKPINAKVRELCEKAQHIFFLAYREGLSKAHVYLANN